jgi:hypothetical protein
MIFVIWMFMLTGIYGMLVLTLPYFRETVIDEDYRQRTGRWFSS